MKHSIKARIVALAALVLSTAASCTPGELEDAKDVTRDVNNIARMLCEATMGSEAERQGISLRELCMLPYVIAPFLEAPNLASANAVLGRELDATPRCTP
jgi:hypothetical protein